MNWKEKNLKFSIRKFNIGVASAVIGMTAFGVATPKDIVSADETEAKVSQKTISYQYVLESELTSEEKTLIQSQISNTVTEDTDTYYMVYRPTSALPKTGSTFTNLAALGLGASLFVIGLKNVKGRKRPIITSLMLLTSAGMIGVSSVSAVQGTALASYNREYQLTVGSELPTTIINIDNFEFVGYILEGDTSNSGLDSTSSSRPLSSSSSATSSTDARGMGTEDSTDQFDSLASSEETNSSAESTSQKSDATSETSEETKESASTSSSTKETASEKEITTEVVVSENVTSEIQYSEVETSEVITSTEVVSEVVSSVIETSEVTEDGEVITSTEVVSEVVSSVIETSEVITSTSTVSEVVTSTELVSEVVSEITSEEASEEVSETVSEETSEDVSEAASEEVSETVSEETSEEVSETVSEETSEEVSETVSEETSEEVSEAVSEETSEDVSEEISEEVSEAASEETSEEASEAVSEEISEEVSEVASEETSEAVSEETSEEVSETVSEETSEVTSEETSEASSEVAESEAVVEVRERTIPYRSVVIEDDTLPLGQTVVQIAGVDGIQELTYVDGKMTRINVIKSSVTEVVRLGTKTVNKEGLIEQFDLAQNLSETDYSPITWAALQTALKTAQSIIDNQELLEQAEIDNATNQLTSAIAALAVEKTHLKEAIDSTEDLVETDYSPESWQTLLAALPVAVEVYDDQASVQSLVNETTDSLVDAISQLTVDDTELKAAVEEVLALIESDYSLDSWSALTSALEAAQVLTSNDKAKQSAINAAKDDLLTALSNLDTDKTALITTINEANDLDQARYTAKTWSNLQSALTDSTAIKEESTAKQSEIDIATTLLASAIDSLELLLSEPTVVYSDITTDALDKTATISYHVTDNDKTLISLKLSVYDGEELVHQVEVTDLSNNDVTLPYYDTTYRLVTDYTYELNDDEGVRSSDIEAEVEIELKKIEIKDIDDLALYQYDATSGSYNRVPTLAALPENVENYFVRITSDIYKDILLAVASIEEVQSEEGYVNYKITTNVDELVQDIDDSAISEYVEQFSFLLAQTPSEEANVYTSFATLIEAMNTNPSGTFTLGANLYADEVEPEEVTYVTKNFTGTLSGDYNGQQFAIYNLAAPLFGTTSGATIENLDLKNVSISTANSHAASLALLAYNTTIENVAVQGSVIGSYQVGGLTAGAYQTYLNNVSFEGQAVTTSRTGQTYLGGITAYLNDSVLTNAYVNADIVSYGDSTLSSSNFRIGGIAGHVYNQGNTFQDLFGTDTNLENAYVQGTVTMLGTGGNVGGIVGSTYYSRSANAGSLKNVLSDAQVSSGNGVYGLANNTNNISNAYVTDQAMAQNAVTVLDSDEVEAVLATMDITVSLEDTSDDVNYSIDYTSLRYANAAYETAYENVAKLIPFYNKEQIVKYGNLVSESSKLFTTNLLSVTPMVDDAIVTDLAANKTAINRIMLYFADESVEYLNVNYLEDFKNTAISEYSIAGTALIYTPESFISSYDAIVNTVQSALESVDYKSQAVADAIGAYTDQDVQDLMATGLTETAAIQQLVEERMDALYLEDAFTAIQSNLTKELVRVLATSSLINSDGGVVDSYLADYILENKEKLLLGLAYMTRWYDVNFGNVSLQTLATYYQDFYGKPVNTLEWLVSLADTGYDNIKLANNVTTYAQSLASNTGYISLLDYLSANRQLFTDYETDNDWFKETTSAYVAEVASAELPDQDVDVYTKLSFAEQQQNILPLLTAEEGIYLMTNISTITYGMFAAYMDMNLKETDPQAYQEAVEYVKGLVDDAAKAQASHIDAMYRISSPTVRENLIRTIPVWDTYFDQVSGEWLSLTADSANQAIKDFFGPVEADTIKYTNTAAYSIRHDNVANTRNQSVHYVSANALSNNGLAIYTHELTHIFDRNTYLDGYTHRSGQGDEDYAQGLFESPVNYDDSFFALNTIQDFTDVADVVTRYTNVSPDRFQSAEDLQEYMHGVMDVIYLLDYAEANSVLAQSDSVVRNWYYVLSNVYDANGNATDSRRNLTTSEAATLETWEDLVTSSLIDRRYYGLTTNSRYSRNSYYDLALFSSFYSALMNEQGGAAGGLTFRRMAFEFLASAGYDGLVAYTSDQYDNDDDILWAINRLQGTNYATYTDYKLAMFQERIDQLDQLTSTTINYLGQDVNITSFDQIQELMTAAVIYDSANSSRITANTNLSRVYQLKAALYNAYLRQTNDFTTSIF